MTEFSEETREFLSKLYQGTNKEKLSWRAQSKTSFSISTTTGDVELKSRDGDDRHPFVLIVRGPDEVPVLELITSIGDLPENIDDGIAQLYALVKNQALGISKVLNSIAGELGLDE
jgi:hypothetical protein